LFVSGTLLANQLAVVFDVIFAILLVHLDSLSLIEVRNFRV
jgi:hypothetical protein